MKDIRYKPIGIIHSPFKKPEGTPIQPEAAKNVTGTVELFSKYTKGLKDLVGFSHIILIYHFHLIHKSHLYIKPFMDRHFHGIFATRAPSRPNPIGISVVRLINIKGNKILVKDIDIVDETPVLDIKPYVPEFDIRRANKKGWLDTNVYKLPSAKDDGRFIKNTGD